MVLDKAGPLETLCSVLYYLLSNLQVENMRKTEYKIKKKNYLQCILPLEFNCPLCELMKKTVYWQKSNN